MSDKSTEENAMDEPCATSSPKNHKKQKTSHRILPEEYSVVIDDTNEWNPDEAFIDVRRRIMSAMWMVPSIFTQSTQLNESEVTFATSSFSTPSSAASSLSSGSLSNMLEMARQMIANYPNEEQIAEMVAENYINYIRDLTQGVSTGEVMIEKKNLVCVLFHFH